MAWMDADLLLRGVRGVRGNCYPSLLGIRSACRRSARRETIYLLATDVDASFRISLGHLIRELVRKRLAVSEQRWCTARATERKGGVGGIDEGYGIESRSVARTFYQNVEREVRWAHSP